MGHSTFKLKTPGGKIILIDPWVQNNPACPDGLKKVSELDIMAVTHGHFDHIGDAVSIGKQHQPKVVGIYEICVWLNSKGLKNIMPMNKGGTQAVDGIKFTMVHADHSCGIQEEDGSIIYGGEAVGYVIELENGFRIYHSGDTAVFSDMKLIAEIYKPELAMIPIGDLFIMSPARSLICVQVPGGKIRYTDALRDFSRTYGDTGYLKELTKDIKGMEIIALKPGETLN